MRRKSGEGQKIFNKGQFSQKLSASHMSSAPHCVRLWGTGSETVLLTSRYLPPQLGSAWSGRGLGKSGVRIGLDGRRRKSLLRTCTGAGKGWGTQYGASRTRCRET